jgi:hypothetical protein
MHELRSEDLAHEHALVVWLWQGHHLCNVLGKGSLLRLFGNLFFSALEAVLPSR